MAKYSSTFSTSCISPLVHFSPSNSVRQSKYSDSERKSDRGVVQQTISPKKDIPYEYQFQSMYFILFCNITHIGSILFPRQ